MVSRIGTLDPLKATVPGQTETESNQDLEDSDGCPAKVPETEVDVEGNLVDKRSTINLLHV